MESKTPQFDSLLDEILIKLVPERRNCKWKGKHCHCEGEFNIEKEDIEFLKMLRVPAPNYCPTCRRMKRFVHINLSRFFKRKCNTPGHNEMLISILPEECPFSVYDYRDFASDNFDAFSFNEEIKKGDDPIEVLFSLRKKFPMPSFLNKDPLSINSDYSNGGRNLKNGYYVFGCYNTENAWYSNLTDKSRNLMDSQVITDSDFIYWCVFSNRIYRSSYIYFSNDCIESMFLFDCRNCSDCFGCINLRNMKYCVYNKQLSKEEYDSFIKSIYPLSRESLVIYEEKFWDLVKKLPMNGTRNVSSDNVFGVNIKNSKDLFDVIDANKSENVRHSDAVIKHKDSMDVSFSGGGSDTLYGTTNVGSYSSKVKFSVSSKFCTESEFIFNSKNCNNCFMCFGLENKSYCILNRQYPKEEYFQRVDEIKFKMLEKGQYSDGIEMEFSAQAYNFSLAQIAYPLSDVEIKKLGGYVAKEPESNAGDIEIIKYSTLPKNIEEVTDSIIDKAILCEISGRPFRITSSELQFLKQMRLPLPNIHPLLRIENRLTFVKNGKKYKVTCANCHKNMESIFDSSENFVLYCEKCYQQEVY